MGVLDMCLLQMSFRFAAYADLRSNPPPSLTSRGDVNEISANLRTRLDRWQSLRNTLFSRGTREKDQSLGSAPYGRKNRRCADPRRNHSRFQRRKGKP